jgi:hypothetical protein
VLEEKQKIIEKEPLEDEELEVFLKESEEIRAEPEVSQNIHAGLLAALLHRRSSVQFHAIVDK